MNLLTLLMRHSVGVSAPGHYAADSTPDLITYNVWLSAHGHLGYTDIVFLTHCFQSNQTWEGSTLNLGMSPEIAPGVCQSQKNLASIQALLDGKFF